jgi:hypothetical protein
MARSRARSVARLTIARLSSAIGREHRMSKYDSIVIRRLSAQKEPQAQQDKGGAAKQHKAGLNVSHDIYKFHARGWLLLAHEICEQTGEPDHRRHRL